MPAAPLLVFLDDPSAPGARAALGGKAAALAELVAAGMPVPPGFALTTAAFTAAETSAHPFALGPSAIEALAEGLDRLAEGDVDALFAVRSSAVEEDGAEHAFAGQLESFLFVPREHVAERIADVWRSAYADRVVAYRRARGLGGDPSPPAVLVQRMLDADAAGVAFSADPVTGRADVAVVAAVRGLGSALVDGRATGETLRVDDEGRVIERTEPDQLVADRFDAQSGSGVVEVEVEEAGPILNDEEAADVADLARSAAAVFGRPQDVEWAIAWDHLWLLQSRPITTLAPVREPAPPVETPGPSIDPPGPTADAPRSAAEPRPSGSLRLWDNSNIAESYGGVTTPLTYSFARRAYEAVYRAFFRLMGVPERRIAAHADTFAGMIGLIRGRVYYNLANWYRALALLPGYRTNARFMEGMMGVRDGIPAHLRPAPSTEGRLADLVALVRTAVGLVVAAARLRGMKRRFYARLDAALALPPGGLDALDLDGLVAHYRDIEGALLRRWDAPLVNDFFAMIAFGLAQRTAEAWVGPGALAPLLAGDGHVISAEPARRIRRLAASVAGDEAFVRTLRTGTVEEVRDGLRDRPTFAADVADYLARFGDRCLEELKLESPTLDDDPTPLYRAIGGLAARAADAAAPPPGEAESVLRAEGERRADADLAGRPVRRFLFRRLLALARARVRDRENLRFERTRVFGRARRIFVGMGERLAAAGQLDDPRDVFSLELHELIGAADGTMTTTDLRGLVDVRRAEFAGYWAEAPPPERFTTRGAVALSPLLQDDTPVPLRAGDETEGEVRTGLGCCPGIVEGPARVVRDPRGATLEPGTILVAERTDPGWILLFPSCAGLVVERGSLLSHSAIVARELAIPAAVAVPGATSWLRDGDRVRLDGATGRVERLALARPPAAV